MEMMGWNKNTAVTEFEYWHDCFAASVVSSSKTKDQGVVNSMYGNVIQGVYIIPTKYMLQYDFSFH